MAKPHVEEPRDLSCYFMMVDQHSVTERIQDTVWKDIPRWLLLRRRRTPHDPLKGGLGNEGQRPAYAIVSPVALILGLISKPVIMFKNLLRWRDVHDS